MLTSAVEELERPCSPMACLNILYWASVTGLAAQAQGCQSWAQLPAAPGAQRAMGTAGRAKMEREYDQRLVVEAYRDALDLLTRRRRGSR